MTAVLPGGLIAVALGLGAVIAYQALAPLPAIEEPALREPAPRPASYAALPNYQPPAEARFAIINERPLFDPARQPVRETEQSEAANLSPPDLSLVGVAIDGRSSVALLKKAEGGAALSVRLGQAIEGWQLVRVEPDFVILRTGVTDYTVRLRQAKGLTQPMVNGAPPPETTRPPGQ